MQITGDGSVSGWDTGQWNGGAGQDWGGITESSSDWGSGDDVTVTSSSGVGL